MNKARFVSLFTAALLTAATVCTANAEDQGVPLSRFENQVESSLALRASAQAVDATQAGANIARDRSGLQFIASSQNGPRRDVVDNYLARSYVRYEQDAGVRVPVLGTRAQQDQDVVRADTETKLAKLEYEATRLQLVTKVRQSYIQYWAASRQQTTAQAFAEELQGEGAATSALAKNGFWTTGDQLRYANMIRKARTDESRALTAQEDALQQLSLLIGAQVKPFTPVEPDFAECNTSVGVALVAAAGEDIELARIATEEAQAQALTSLQRWDGYDVGLDVALRTYVDQPGGTGLGFYIGADFSGPMHFRSLRGDETAQLSAQLNEYKLLAQERRAELRTGITVALSDRSQAVQELAQARNDNRAIAEDVRESRVRLTYVAPSSLSDVQTKMQALYGTQMAMIQDQSAVLLKTVDVMQVAPGVCSSPQAVLPQQVGKQ